MSGNSTPKSGGSGSSATGNGTGSDIQSGGSLLEGMGKYEQGMMTADSLRAQADLQQEQADEAEAAGQFNATKEMLQAHQRIGSAIAGFGASGVASTSVSMNEVLRNSAQNAELDRLNILHGADVKAINYENQAALDRYGAESSEFGAKVALVGSGVKAAASAAG